MKKSKLIIAGLALLGSLTACSSKENTPSSSSETTTVSQTQQEIAVTFIIKTQDTEVKKSLQVPLGQSVLEVLSANFEVVAADGFVTAIDGKEQEPEKNLYWMYSVNDKEALVGSGEYHLNDGDQVLFQLEKVG